MTKLCEMIMECRAVKGMDRLVLFGWASQLEEGNDTLYCSKETVAEAIGVSEDTVLRRTQALVKAGWLIDTGDQKQWEFARTPVRIINVPVIVGLVEAQCRKLRPCLEAPPQIAPPQNAAQGSRSDGSMVLGVDVCVFSSTSTATGVPPADSGATTVNLPENLTPKTFKPENLEPTPTPVPTVGANGERNGKVCPKCSEPWSRDRNHVCSMANSPMPKSQLDEFDDMRDEGWEPSGLALGNRGWKQRNMEPATAQKSAESIVGKGRTTATPAAFAQSPVPPLPHGMNSQMTFGMLKAEQKTPRQGGRGRHQEEKKLSSLRVLIHKEKFMEFTRTKCLAPRCPAMACPSATGYCSYHDLQRTPLGQRPSRPAGTSMVASPPPTFRWEMPMGNA